MTWDDVTTLGLRFPEVEVSTSYRRPALKAGGKWICSLRTDPDALVVLVSDLGEKEALLQGDPSAYFTTPHYDGYAAVLVRLDRADPTEIGELLEDAWRSRVPKRVVAAFEAGR